MSITLEEAREELFANVEDGTMCPCCDQYARQYKRKLNSCMAGGLIWLVRQFERIDDWVDVPRLAPRFVIRTNQLGTLAHWQLVTPKHNTKDPRKKHLGWWKPTQWGIDFVYESTRVPKYVYLYDNHPRRFSEEMTTIKEALGDRFDYEELMGSR